MTVTSTLKLPDQLAALAKLNSFDASYLVNSRGKFPTEYVNGGAIRELIPMLRAVGIEPTDAAAYDRLTAVELPRPVTPQGRRLDVTPETYATRVREESIYRVTHREAEDFAALERQVMLRELAQSMRAEADDYVSALRAAFDSAMADFTKLVDLGLTVASTPQQAIELDSAIEPWRRATTGASSTKVLEGVYGIRIRLSMALGVQPINTEAYAGPVRFGVAFGVGNEFDQYDGWRRSLAIAATGTAQLRSIAEVDSVVAERRRRALGIQVPISAPTSDDPRPPSPPATPKRRPGIVDSDAEPRPDDLATAGF